ncbi:alkaline phosphatase [Thioalkalivibrio sp. XN8]|uniref:alkaline phosphatase n=1 Tax=Thioalkalivibrio sp. XN8 TaxID=2712863 RepID=UPI0013EE3ADC|nr:alkaline phosphatase [Thioalkalivibrio sp. XN8]NGP53126.1 alkaline phosphatase [Thioalkalivibrio sp. XN8]
MKLQRLFAILVLAVLCAGPAPAQDGGARNVILMIADGIGFNGWLAADYYQGRAGTQSYQVGRPDGSAPVVYGMTHYALNLVDADGRILPSRADARQAAGAVPQGYDPALRWQRFDGAMRNDFPPVGLNYTSYTDSAASGTALLTGRKTANGRINMDWRGEIAFRTIAQVALEQGRAAGVVTSVQASHATPAAVIAHNSTRSDMAGIFREMLASDLAVIMGAGHPGYDSSGNRVEPPAGDAESFAAVGGPETWAALAGGAGPHVRVFIEAKSDFEALAAGDEVPARVVGIARSRTTLQADRQGLPAADEPSGMALNPAVPTLAVMATGALNVLGRDPGGFFLAVEGGAVDWMGHDNDLPRFIEEQAAFNEAVAAVIAWVEANSGWDETLLVITSDHETGGLWGEGTFRNGTGGWLAADRSEEAVEAARYQPAEDTFLGFRAVQDRGAGRMPGHQWASGRHTNELVPLWALGAGAGRFAEFARTDLQAAALWGEPYGWDGGYVDNTAVFHVMREALAR